jgi:hypothetical protein
MSTEALIAKLSAMQGKFLGDGVHENVNRSELIAALAAGGAEPVAWQERQEVSPGVFGAWYESPRRERDAHREIESGGIRYQFRPLYAAPSPLAAWQPIETAPKERELLLFRADAGIFTGIWTSFSSFATQGECDICDEDVLFSEGWFYGDYRNCGRLEGSEEPTHWMELPLVPVWPLDESAPAAQPATDSTETPS